MPLVRKGGERVEAREADRAMCEDVVTVSLEVSSTNMQDEQPRDGGIAP